MKNIQEQGIKTKYMVQYMKELGKWKPYFFTGNEDNADNIAAFKTDEPVHVRILEMHFRNRRLIKIIEYKVNPPHCSNSGLPPRGPEKVLRGYLDIGDIPAF